MKEEQIDPLTFIVTDWRIEVSFLACQQVWFRIFTLQIALGVHRAEIGCCNVIVMNYSFTT